MKKEIIIVAAIFLAISVNAQKKEPTNLISKPKLYISRGIDTFFIKRKKNFENILYNGKEIPLSEMIQKSTCSCNKIKIRKLDISEVKIFRNEKQELFGMFLKIIFENSKIKNSCIFTLTYNTTDKTWGYTEDDLNYNL